MTGISEPRASVAGHSGAWTPSASNRPDRADVLAVSRFSLLTREMPAVLPG